MDLARVYLIILRLRNMERPMDIWGYSVNRLTRTVMCTSAAGALAITLLIAPPASAANYAPGLPEPVAGEPNNPPASYRVTPAVVVVDSKVARETGVTERLDVKNRIGQAAKPEIERGDPVALVARGLIPGARYIAQIKRKGGSYGTLGSIIALPNGTGDVPVFRVDRGGVYIIAITNVATGATQYLKVTAI